MKIALGIDQYNRAVSEATRRQLSNEHKVRNGNHKGPTVGAKAQEAHRVGCLGEMAVAVMLGLEDHVFTETDPVPNSCDLPGNIDVKTRTAKWHDLIVPLIDNPDKIYVLVILHHKEIDVCGWIHRKDAAKNHWKENIPGRGIKYVIPKEGLEAMSTLKEYINKLEVTNGKSD